MLVAGTVLSACGSDDKSSSPTELKVTVTANGDKFKLDAPTSIDGGVVNLSFTNSAQGPHSLQFVKVTGTHTTDELITFLNESENGGPVPDWISEGGGIGDVAPGQTGKSTFKLTDGLHFVWDDETNDSDVNYGTLGALAEITVKGNGDADATLPDASGSITAKEYEFTVQGLKAGSNTIRFDNTGQQFHHFIAAPIAAGKTLDDVKTFFNTQGDPGGPPPLDFEKGVGGAVVGPGNAVVYNIDLEAGSYAMVCFVNDKAGGPPHFTLGMLQQVSVA